MYVGGCITGATVRKVEGTGTVNTVVTSVTGERILLSTPEAPENLFMDFGKGRLQNGYAYARLEPNFSKNIVVNEKHPLRVFITLGGDCKGVYVTNTSAEGFEVRELQGGTSNVEFYWQVVANRADEYDAFGRRIPYSEERFPAATPPLPVVKAEVVQAEAVPAQAIEIRETGPAGKGKLLLPSKGQE